MGHPVQTRTLHSPNEQSIEHSEKRIITQSRLFENKVRPRVLQSNVQQTSALKECQGHKAQAIEGVLILS